MAIRNHRHRRPLRLDRPVGAQRSGFDALLIAIVLVLIVTALRNVVPYLLPSRKDR